MSSYTPKSWAVDDAITTTDLNHIEDGIDDITGAYEAHATALSAGTAYVTLTADKTASVNGTLTTYAQPAAPIVLADFTPTLNCRLVFSGFVSLKHSSTTGTPDLAWGILDSTGTTLLHGALGNRSRVSAAAPTALPVCGSIDLSAGTAYDIRLAVSSSVSGTVTIMDDRTHVTCQIVPL